jgi:hypothetical protein
VSHFMHVMLLSYLCVVVFLIIPQFVVMSFMCCSAINNLIEGCSRTACDISAYGPKMYAGFRPKDVGRV